MSTPFLPSPGSLPVGALLPSMRLSLDDLTGGAVFAAHSLHQLRTAYTGPLVQVRNSSNALADIGFDANGELNKAALLAHAGSGDAFVATWYDQSGNGRHVTAPTDAAQPRIVVSGAVEVMNGYPCLHPLGAAQLYRASTVFGDQPQITTIGLFAGDVGANPVGATVFGSALSSTYSYEPMRVITNTTLRFDARLGSTNDQNAAPGAITPGVPAVVSTTDTPSSGTAGAPGAITIFVNGKPVKTGTIVKALAGSAPNRYGMFARHQSTASALFVGKAETFISYTGLPDIGNVIADLAYRGGITL